MSAPAAPGRLYGGLTAQERVARRREQLLDAGLERFAAEGWAGATVHDICREAGLSQRYFYEAFASREALFVALLERTSRELTAVMRHAAALDERTPAARADAVLAALADAFAGDPRLVRVALVESCATPEFRAHRTALLQAFAAQAAALMRALAPAGADDASLRRSALVLAGGVAELLMADAVLEDRDALLAHLAALVRAAAEL